MDVSRRTIERDRIALGLAVPRPRWSPDEQQRALAMLADGASLWEVARTLGRDYETIWLRFRGMGWTRQQCNEYREICRLEKRMWGK